MDYEEAFASIPIPATLIDAQGVIVDVNEAFLEYARSRGRPLTRPDRIGRHVVDFVSPKQDPEAYRVRIERLLADGEPWERLESLIGADGRPLHVRVQARAIVHDGVVTGAVILREDRTAAVLGEQQRELAQRLREEIWRLRDAGDMERLLVAVRDGLRRLGLPFQDCGVNLVEPEVPRVRFHNMTAEGSWSEAFSEDSGAVVLDFWRRGEVVYRPDLEREDRFTELQRVRDIFGRRVRCIIDVPFSHGTLALNSDLPEAFTEHDVEILADMARVLSEGFERQANLEALRRSEERYRTAVGQIADAILLIDHDRKCIVETNEACQRLLGYSEAELAGRSVFDVVAHDADSVDANGELALSQGQLSVGERRLRHRDGRLLDVEVSLSRIEASGARMVCAVARDIGERKRAENRRASLQRLREEVWRMQTGQDIGNLLDVARQCLADMGVNFDHFGINVVRPANPNPVQIFTRGTQPLRMDAHPQRSMGTIVEWWRARRPVYRADLATEDPYNEREVLQDAYGHAIRSVLDVPFSHGTVAANSRRPRAFDEADVACLGEVAEALSDGFRRTDDLARLSAQREYLAVTLRSIGDGVIATDESGRVQLMNAAAERLTGWTQTEAEGRPLPEVFRIVDETTREPCENPVHEVVRSGRVMALAQEAMLLARDGHERLLADSAAPIRGEDDAIIGAVLVFQDVSVQRQSERERERAARLESVGLLAGGIAHDFNNILTGITGSLSLARLEAGGNAPLDELLAAAESAAQRASKLTGQLLTFARGGAPARRSVDLASTVREGADFALRGSNVAIEYSLPDELWPVHADPNQLGQVVQNLVINADQAMPQGGRIRIEASNTEPDAASGLAPGRYVRLQIRDQGSGIDPNIASRLFEPYFTTKESGSGLGLATVYAIVEQHEGRIAVESPAGQGATFTLHLPAAASPAPPPAGQERLPPRGTGQRILVMDDEEAVLGLLEKGLANLGYEFESAADGAEAVRVCGRVLEQGQRVDAAILDLTVPGGMGGAQALVELRRLAPELPVIVSSGYSNDPILADFRGHGFQGMLPKPYRIGELARVLAEVLAD